MSAPDTQALEGLKDKHRATWTAGDYPDIAEVTMQLAEPVVDAAGAREGMTLLDVATGTGNVAVVAAERGAQVTGLDLTASLIDVAKQRSSDVEWIVGDAEELPFGDASFDCVTSAIGIQFAPRHGTVADELVRVLRPGGRLVLANWTRDGMIGQLFATMGRHLPPPPPFASSPALWGDEDHVRELFEPHGLTPSFERRSAIFPFTTGEAYIDYFETRYGPTLLAAKALGDGWAPVREEIKAHADRFMTPDGVQQDYWLITADRP
jgi:ubiquinone/menaquinone biosynthesis C-methylase UbiE